MFNQTHKISENNTAALTITFYNTKDSIIRVLIGFNQSHKISENNTAVLTITFSNTKDTIIRVIIGLVK